MRKIIRHYKPGEAITLYDISAHALCRGVLIITPVKERERFSDTKINFGKIAVFFAVISLLTVMYIFAPIQLSYFFSKLNNPSVPIAQSVQKTNKNVISGNYITNTAKQPITEFKIVIPKINLESNIIPYVDMNSEQSYLDSLKYGVAHANGSYLPGQNGAVYLFAHSTDTVANILKYNAKFFAVKDLNVGDEIDIYFNNKLYKYFVTSKEIIDPTNIDVIRQSKSDLILQTCWPPGTDWQRLIVFATAAKTF